MHTIHGSTGVRYRICEALPALASRFARTRPESFNFEGLRLRTLIIDDWDYCSLMPAIACSIDVSEISLVENICTKLHSADPLWRQQDLEAVSICLTARTLHDSDTSVRIVPAHMRWRRVYHIATQGLEERCPIRALPALLRVGECVTYLRVDSKNLTAFLEAGWPPLAALRALRVDCKRSPELWPSERHGYVSCPALETLTLCACDAAVSFASRDVALLGGALAQRDRDARERAALVLVGVELELPVDDALLRETFSSVRFCAYGSSWDRDGGLWDERW